MSTSHILDKATPIISTVPSWWYMKKYRKKSILATNAASCVTIFYYELDIILDFIFVSISDVIHKSDLGTHLTLAYDLQIQPK